MRYLGTRGRARSTYPHIQLHNVPTVCCHGSKYTTPAIGNLSAQADIPTNHKTNGVLIILFILVNAACSIAAMRE